jgi:hypothetical protein
MRVGVLHVNSSSANSTSPTMRIARFAAHELSAPLIHDLASARRHTRTSFDVLLVKYGVLKFSDHREEALRIYDQAKYVINMENDYTFGEPDKRFRTADETWSTVERRTRMVNWNVLTRLPLESWKELPRRSPVTMKGIIYYGAHRDDRVKSFVRYFRGAPYPVTISTFRGGRKFAQTCGGLVSVTGAFKDPKFPAAWPATVYIEDETSHRLYCSPAARFYECLQIGLTQLIDRAAVDTLERAGFRVPRSCVVDGKDDVVIALRRCDTILEEQQGAWLRDFSRQLRREFWTAAGHAGIERKERC